MTATAPTIPPMPPVEQYGAAMARFALAAMRHSARPNPDAPRIVMYLTPWYRQGAAWFAVGLGIAMATRAGARVEFLINDMPYPSIHPHELNEIAALDAFCGQFEALFPFHRLSRYYGTPDADRRAVVEDVVAEALRIDIRHRTGCGTLAMSQAQSFARTARTPITHITTAFDRFLSAERPDVVFCPGGAANGTYAVHLLTNLHGLRFASADSNVGRLYLAPHDIAGRFAENADTYRHLAGLSPAIANEARDRGYAILSQRITEARERNDQLPPCDLILALGYDWDTGALGLKSLYVTQDDWLMATVNHVLKHHPGTHMVLRQHPLEATMPSQENVDIIADLERRGLDTLHVMRAADKVPVYGLFEKTKAAVACQSTVVMESQALGVPSACMRDTHYVTAGVVKRPQTREAYFAWLDAQLSGQRDVIPQDARDAAALDFFVMQTCMTEYTRFTPQAADLWAWLNDDPVANLKSDTISDIVRCVVTDVGVSTMKARRALGLSGLPDGIADPIAA